MDCHLLLQGIFRTQGWNPSLLWLLHWQVGSVGKESTCNAGDFLQHRKPDSIPELAPNLEKEMAIHSSILAWEIPGTEKPVGLQSLGLQSQTGLNN